MPIPFEHIIEPLLFWSRNYPIHVGCVSNCTSNLIFLVKGVQAFMLLVNTHLRRTFLVISDVCLRTNEPKETSASLLVVYSCFSGSSVSTGPIIRRIGSCIHLGILEMHSWPSDVNRPFVMDWASLKEMQKDVIYWLADKPSALVMPSAIGYTHHDVS